MHFNYQFTVGATVTEEVPGQRLYYSLSAASNTWTTLPAVSGLNTSGLISTNAIIGGEPPTLTSQTSATLTVSGLDMYGYKYRLAGAAFTNAWSKEMQQFTTVYQITLSGATATALVTNHGYANGDTIEMLGADALTPYFNGLFSITSVTANSFSYTVTPGTNGLINQTQPRDLWCVKPQQIQLNALSNGTYHVEAVRKNSQSVWQSTNNPTLSKSWTVGLGPLAASMAANTATLTVQVEAGKTYTLLSSPALQVPLWTKFTNLSTPSSNGAVQVPVPGMTSNSARFFRLVSPAQP